MSMGTRLVSVGTHMPAGWMPASEIADRSGIPEDVIIERFGLDGKHIAGPEDHVSTMAAAAGLQAIERAGISPEEVDVVAYFGSMWKDYNVWSASPKVMDIIGARNAWALEMANVSCGAPVAISAVSGMLAGDPSINNVLLVGGCRESHLLDYTNERSRFMFNFGDGGAAALLSTSLPGHEILSYKIITDGQFADDVAVYAGGSKMPASHQTVDNRAHYLDVENPQSMKERLDPVSGPNFVKVVQDVCSQAGVDVSDIKLLPILHTKQSIHHWIVDAIGVPRDRAVYIRRHGHMSGLDTIVGLDMRQDELESGDLILLLSAGTGYTWAGTLLRW
jgi:3-oxoacyl-[acyl-carrier-protein] synthase-3